MKYNDRIHKIILFIVLQIINIVYSLNSVLIKFASISWEKNGLFYWKTLCFLSASIGLLGVYAIVWQIILSKVKLSIAYMNKSLLIFWGLVWSVLFFREEITYTNIYGTLIIFVGILLVNKYE